MGLDELHAYTDRALDKAMKAWGEAVHASRSPEHREVANRIRDALVREWMRRAREDGELRPSSKRSTR